MNFKQALEILANGGRVISKQDKHIFDQQWLSKNLSGTIDYMNEPWNPSPDWLLQCFDNEWIDIDKDCDYHDCPGENCELKKQHKELCK